MRDLDQDTGAITGIFLAAAGPAMHEVPEDGERVGNDAMRTSTLDVHDKTDATGIMLKRRVIQTLLPRSVICRFQFIAPFPASLVSIATSIYPENADQPILFLAPVSEIRPRSGKFILLPGKSAKKHQQKGEKVYRPARAGSMETAGDLAFTQRKSGKSKQNWVARQPNAGAAKAVELNGSA